MWVEVMPVLTPRRSIEVQLDGAMVQRPANPNVCRDEVRAAVGVQFAGAEHFNWFPVGGGEGRRKGLVDPGASQRRFGMENHG
jgi:hypothetical protein